MTNLLYKKIGLLAASIMLIIPANVYSSTTNIAPRAKVTVSNFLNDSYKGENLVDGIIMSDGKGEWACKGNVTSWGELYLPWAKLEWTKEVNIEKVVLYDRPSLKEHISGGTLEFSDGSSYSVTCIPNDGSAKEILFPEGKRIKWLRFQATDGDGKDIGLSEIEVYKARDNESAMVEWVDPYIETTRGRWFYCTPGARPFGMIAAHAFTRNKNQGGGGYNYNFPYILGFSQINEWMISGPNIMPVSGKVDPRLGMDGWKSSFKHEGEIIQPGYHRLFLDRYKTWVEYTASDRVAFYRCKYMGKDNAKLLLDVGSKLGNCSMDKGTLTKINDHRITGEFYTTNRFWGGPDSIRLFFVLEINKPIKSMIGWNGNQLYNNCSSVSGDDSGMLIDLGELDDNELEFKIALSYTSINSAVENLNQEVPGWDFDALKSETQSAWNEYLGRISVEGSSKNDKIKLYTDLWHVLLGRNKINDVNGHYPDYTKGPYKDKRTSCPLRVRQLPLVGGKPKFNMYGFDGLWLTQWNLNVLWGIAWPEVLDDFTACLVQYADNGKLLPRGACSGGYSFIMTSCPSTSMIVSAYMQGLMKKTSPKHAFQVIKANHMPGGMMSYESADDLRFYIKNGYCPNSAGKTLEWAFEDWGAAQMAHKLGLSKDYHVFLNRSLEWTPLFCDSLGLIFPKDEEGRWTNLDPLSGKGWVEANSWQATWSVSHDLTRLIKLMGGSDKFCDKLNNAFEKASSSDFIASYSNGYVSYANQPGCSNAHLFSYGGKPWLTQYWVRRVREQAYGGITPDKGYGGHDEDEGQMGGISALMSLGLFSVTGLESPTPYYDITSPLFDRITIKLSPKYYKGKDFTIITHNNSTKNCYIQSAKLNGQNWEWSQLSHDLFQEGGTLELWLGDKPNKSWGKLKYTTTAN
jgi:predicted alpha-1,2-mannosidase